MASNYHSGSFRSGQFSAGSQEPSILLVPGLDNSGPAHWQTLWEEQFLNCRRVDLGMWERPNRNNWVNKLNLAIRQESGPVILVAHSLGCHAVAWWAALERPAPDGQVRAAMLVAPPEIDAALVDPRLAAFGPSPKVLLPFRSLVVASQDDPYMAFHRAHNLAIFWGSDFVDAGALGHINAESDIGAWGEGKALLRQLTRAADAPPAPLPPVSEYTAMRNMTI